tara:strand:- start:1430 stop:1687 length:258 start_codon:yes stop_codon:yes gene_type:complete
MKKIIFAAILSAAAAPAFAEPSCNPGSEVTPVWQSLQKFEQAGGQVVSFKTTAAVATKSDSKVDGENMEIFFDPNTGEELERIAA